MSVNLDQYAYTNVSVSRISDINNATFDSGALVLYHRTNAHSNFLLFFVIAFYFCKTMPRNCRYYCKDTFKVKRIASWIERSLQYALIRCNLPSVGRFLSNLKSRGHVEML